MVAEHTEDDDVARVLTAGYAAPMPEPPFVEELCARLRRELVELAAREMPPTAVPMRRGTIWAILRFWPAMGAVALCVAVAAALLLQGPRKSGPDTPARSSGAFRGVMRGGSFRVVCL